MVSGLQIQNKKTVVFGKIRNDNVLCSDLGLRWEQEFKLLCVLFDHSQTLNLILT